MEHVIPIKARNLIEPISFINCPSPSERLQ